jgi:hypothetical protein
LNPEAAKWYESEGLMQNGRFLSSVFIDVFYEGKLIDSVPLSKEKLERKLQVELNCSEDKHKDNGRVMTSDMFRSLACGNEIDWEPITPRNYFEEMRMCLTNYPYGSPPERFHRVCTELKSKIFTEVFQNEDVAGLFGSYDNKVIGLVRFSQEKY